ncbi:MAG: nicotinate (nicotinamide) nucleotide adenylyltransferase [Oscillospiraceae bacterium]|nr:nicotinate (nicotinamide) nucleotide adenylyltransferase [Oscillospiraceae bacterium]
MKIGVYGGTYNPPHLGHMAAARDAAEKLGLDLLLLIPDNTPPHKELPAGSPTAQQRLEMTRIAADRLQTKKTKVVASDIELKREGRSYSAHTLTQLRELYPKDELWLLMGTDMFLTLHQWYRPDIICQCAKIAAFGRAAGDTDHFAEQKKRLKKEFGAKVKYFDLPGLIEASSTQIREALLEGRGRELLDESIYGYILLHGLYGLDKDLTNLSLEELRAASYSMVKAKRLPHIKGTEEECALLARRWGADETDARRAAILHDCTKFWNLEEQLQYCQKYDILLDQIEEVTLPLLHAKSGAGVAKQVFGMPDAICEAIRWHTTGKADMTLLEKILYIGDYAEPSRSYDWCHKLRKLVMENLDQGVLYGLEITIDHTRKKDNLIHYRTLEARDFLLAQQAADSVE